MSGFATEGSEMSALDHVRARIVAKLELDRVELDRIDGVANQSQMEFEVSKALNAGPSTPFSCLNHDL